jgi:hypothetical protein
VIYEDSGCDGCPSVASDKRSITGRDRLTWRKDGVPPHARAREEPALF